MPEKKLPLVSFVISLLALVLAAFILILGLRAKPLSNELTPETPPLTLPPSGADEISAPSFIILSVVPESGSEVSWPFDITITTDEATGAGISSGDCEATTPNQGVHFQALLALDLLPKQTVNKITVNEQTLNTENLASLRNCKLTVTVGTQAGDIMSRELEYTFAR